MNGLKTTVMQEMSTPPLVATGVETYAALFDEAEGDDMWSRFESHRSVSCPSPAAVSASLRQVSVEHDHLTAFCAIAARWASFKAQN